MTPEQILQQTFGYPAFRGLQSDAIHHVTDGGDALVLMPTGGGKSVCYQIPALCRAGTGLVVSPLIALMDDQVAALRQLGIAAGALHSDLDANESMRVSDMLNAGKLDLLYVSPERLLANGMLERLRRRTLALIAIDEAHCVSAWGHEFRPEYRALSRLAQIFPGVPRIALTATADTRTRDDIIAALDMPSARVFTASFHRSNLNIAAEPKSRETTQLLEFLTRHRGEAGIVYCGSRNKTERVAAKLKDKGVAALAFHAGMSPLEKRVSLTRFRGGEAVVVVATIAFGMGIDRPDVRFVLHLDMPDSPEAYYQQIGRAGRDGDPAYAMLLYGGEDMARARHWLSQSTAPDAQKQVMRQRLEAMIALAETSGCRTQALLRCFGENLAEPCGHCDTCRAPRATFDGTDAAQKVLSAVYRTGQIFGARHIVDVLRGEATKAVESRSHDKLALFGIGRAERPQYWRGVIRQLIARGALQVKEGEFASLELVPETARPILRGEQTILLQAEPAPPPRRAASATVPASPQAEAAPMGIEASSLFEALRRWRMQVARAQSVPPYVIFHDTVLRDIAENRPANRADLAAIRGVGGSKLLRYGDAVLALVRQYANG
jgi:ATP-dependent DNA helicase RecQ